MSGRVSAATVQESCHRGIRTGGVRDQSSSLKLSGGRGEGPGGGNTGTHCTKRRVFSHEKLRERGRKKRRKLGLGLWKIWIAGGREGEGGKSNASGQGTGSGKQEKRAFLLREGAQKGLQAKFEVTVP